MLTIRKNTDQTRASFIVLTLCRGIDVLFAMLICLEHGGGEVVGLDIVHNEEEPMGKWQVSSCT